MNQVAREARRDAIIAAATRLMLERGPSVEIDAIAKEAGIGKGTVYLYFKSKEEVIGEVRDAACAPGPSETLCARAHLLLEIAMLDRDKFASEFADSPMLGQWLLWVARDVIKEA